MKSIIGKSRVLLLVSIFCLVSSPALAKGNGDDNKNDQKCGPCTITARVAYKACGNEIRDDYWIAVGNCINLSDPEAVGICMETAKEGFMEAEELCADQKGARLDICEELGEAAYDPVIDPDDFVDFARIINGEQTLTPNQHFPLIPGTAWEYLAKDENGTAVERIRVEVLTESKEILGVNCIVVHDRVWEIDRYGVETLAEDTDDWYAQDTFGNVWYFGEISMGFEDGELVSIDGSWKAGRESAKAGFIMLADPQEGDIYRQEFSLGNAEDIAKVMSRGEKSVSVPFGTYSVDVLETKDFTPIEPDVFELKYYAPGVGIVLEVNPETGERVELVDMVTP